MHRFDRRRRPSPAVALLLMIPVLANLPAYGEEKQAPAYEPGKFLRFVEEGNDGGRLETAVATYTNDKGVTVELVGAVHIADTGYYKALNKRFEAYDALLYEMVKPKDMGAPRRGDAGGDGSINFVRMMQKGMKMFLDLDYQLDGIDYTKKNFVHADLTAEEFARMQEERGESIMGLMVKQMVREMLKDEGERQATQLDGLQILAALSSEDSARQLKLVLAKQFENMDEMVKGMEGPKGSVLLTERNKAAIKVLKDEITAGKKNLGLFYGAAHLKDLEKRLVEDMGFKRTKIEYLVAWDMSPNGPGNRAADPAAEQAKDDQIKKLLEKIEKLEKRLEEVEKK